MKANEKGELKGKFKIPASTRAGSKTVRFCGPATEGTAVFVGQGQLTTQVLQSVTNETRSFQWVNFDPLAQTFTLTQNTPVLGVDLWFTAKGDKKVVVQLRETTVGMPNRFVLATKTLNPNEIDITNGTATRVSFDSPVYLQKDREYAIVILTDCNTTALAVAELGQYDQFYKKWITAQPYQIGVLLSSSNASTWTAHQDKDLTFRLLKAEYNTDPKTIDLGTIEVSEITDLMLLALADKPSIDTMTSFVIVLPDGTEREIAENQSMRLPENISGQLQIRAKLTGSTNASPTLLGGSQLLAAKTLTSANYITRGIEAGENSRVKIIFDAFLPVNSSVETSITGADTSSTWTTVPLINSKALDDSFREYIYEANWNDPTVRCKLTLQGTSASRPRIKNLRMLVM